MIIYVLADPFMYIYLYSFYSHKMIRDLFSVILVVTLNNTNKYFLAP
jgi:hypothetical protein